MMNNRNDYKKKWRHNFSSKIDDHVKSIMIEKLSNLELSILNLKLKKDDILKTNTDLKIAEIKKKKILKKIKKLIQLIGDLK